MITPTTPPAARPRARHAAVRRGPRRSCARTTRHFQQVPAAGAGLLRGQGQPRPGDRPARSTRRGASFDVASMPEFLIVHENIKDLPAKERQDWIWDKIIYANPIKANETLRELDHYKPLVTYDNLEEIQQDQEARAARRAGAAPQGAQHRGDGGALLQVRRAPGRGGGPDPRPPTRPGWSSRASASTSAARRTNFENYVAGAQPRGRHLPGGRGARLREDEPARHRRRLPRPLRRHGQALPRAGHAPQRRARPALPEGHRDPRRARPLHGGHRRHAVADHHRQGRPRRQALLLHRRRRLPHLLGHHLRPLQVPGEGVQEGPTQHVCSVFGPTCDALDTISLAEELPDDLELGDLVYSPNIGAYSHASSTWFNGFPPAKVVHVNQEPSAPRAKARSAR